MMVKYNTLLRGKNEIPFYCISGFGKQLPIKIFCVVVFFFNLVLHIKSGYPFQDNFLRFFGKRTRFVNNFLVVPMITLNNIYHYHHLRHPQTPLKT